MINKEEVGEMLKDIKHKLPDEFKQAKWVKEERQRILLEAQKEANNLVKEAENKIILMIDEHEITKKAYDQANEIIANAQKTAREIRLGTKEYADNILVKVEETLKQTIDVIHSNREELR
jgi:vacuolar-type H+-ATPase subunit H